MSLCGLPENFHQEDYPHSTSKSPHRYGRRSGGGNCESFSYKGARTPPQEFSRNRLLRYSITALIVGHAIPKWTCLPTLPYDRYTTDPAFRSAGIWRPFTSSSTARTPTAISAILAHSEFTFALTLWGPTPFSYVSSGYLTSLGASSVPRAP